MPAGIVMGVGVGVANGGTCTLLAGGSTNTAAGTSPQIMGKASTDTLCVLVSDVGNATAPVSYTVTVAHP